MLWHQLVGSYTYYVFIPNILIWPRALQITYLQKKLCDLVSILIIKTLAFKFFNGKTKILLTFIWHTYDGRSISNFFLAIYSACSPIFDLEWQSQVGQIKNDKMFTLPLKDLMASLMC